MEITPAIAELWTLCVRTNIVLFSSRYNGHFGRVEMRYYSVCQRKYFEDRILPQITTLFSTMVQSTLSKNEENILLKRTIEQ